MKDYKKPELERIEMGLECAIMASSGVLPPSNPPSPF